MNFPVIEHIDQVREAIQGREEFFIGLKDGYSFANYKVAFEDSFLNPWEAGISVEEQNRRAILRECRGLIFDQNGKIIRRSYNKFFNHGEKPDEVFLFDIDQEHHILEKLDGSMIAPFKVGTATYWGTKAGFTEVSKKVHHFVDGKKNYSEIAEFCFQNNLTPIFEFCSRKQRIILDYPEDALVLTGIRHLNTGEYWEYKNLVDIGLEHSIPVVKAYGSVSDIAEFVEKTKGEEGNEGYVVRWKNGYHVKIKTEKYVLLHRTIDGLRSEKSAIQLIVNNSLDDALPLLEDYVRIGVTKFADDLNHFILNKIEELFSLVNACKNTGMSKKDFAMNVVRLPDNQKFQKQLFYMWDGCSKEDMLDQWNETVKFISNNSTRLEEQRHFINGMRWNDYLNLDQTE